MQAGAFLTHSHSLYHLELESSARSCLWLLNLVLELLELHLNLVVLVPVVQILG